MQAAVARKQTIVVWWAQDDQYYTGHLFSDQGNGIWGVLYLDGDVRWYSTAEFADGTVDFYNGQTSFSVVAG